MTIYFWRVAWEETEPLAAYGRTPTEDDPRIVEIEPESGCEHDWVNVQADVPERFEYQSGGTNGVPARRGAEWATEIVFEIRFKCLRCGADRLRALPYPA